MPFVSSNSILLQHFHELAKVHKHIVNTLLAFMHCAVNETSFVNNLLVQNEI